MIELALLSLQERGTFGNTEIWPKLLGLCLIFLVNQIGLAG